MGFKLDIQLRARQFNVDPLGLVTSGTFLCEYIAVISRPLARYSAAERHAMQWAWHAVVPIQCVPVLYPEIIYNPAILDCAYRRNLDASINFDSALFVLSTRGTRFLDVIAMVLVIGPSLSRPQTEAIPSRRAVYVLTNSYLTLRLSFSLPRHQLYPTSNELYRTFGHNFPAPALPPP